ncbi:MAG TPA: ferrous iron transport protein B [Phycisphaerae bacterium]|nr:ferrous iron transport protein B [Phycisphaerae bacterium]
MRGTGTSTRLLRAGIAGNPNSGKTSLFNKLTGSNHCVGNYPGVTVERNEGLLHADGQTLVMVDLPGTYSLTAYSAEEVVARNFIIDEHPDVVVDVVDASNLERNLYLAVQLMEMEVPLVIALNMMDVAQRHQLSIDSGRMAELLGVPVVETVGRDGRGKAKLAAACMSVAAGEGVGRVCKVTYGHPLDEHVDALAARIAQDDGVCRMYRPPWVAIKLIEKDPQVGAAVARVADDTDGIRQAAEEAIHQIETHSGDDVESLVAEGRYGFAAGILRQCVRTPPTERRRMTDRVDAVVCNRLLGPAILMGVVYGLFFAVFKVADEWAWLFGKSPTAWMEWLFAGLASAIGGLEATSPMLHSLLADGVIGGVGGVMSFVPLIFVMFAFVAVLEDTGYIARVAFVLDRALRIFGLQGRSMLAMIVSGGLGGGGCAVPGVLATRTMRDPRDRLITMMVAPMMNCGAKIPVYLMLVAAFFAGAQAKMMFLLWALSWTIALMCAWLLRRFVIRGEQTPFVMELPSYHVPTLRGVVRHAWGRTWMYIRKAGTVILAVSLVMWALMFFPRTDASAFDAGVAALDASTATYQRDKAAIRSEQGRARLRQSAAGRMGASLVPISQWAGFDWRDNVALIGGFAAKEVVIGTLGVAYSMGDVHPENSGSLSAQLADDEHWSRLQAVAMLIFVMIYAPCMSTLAVIRREAGSWKWALFSTTYTTILAFVLAVGVFQVGRLLGLEG